MKKILFIILCIILIVGIVISVITFMPKIKLIDFTKKCLAEEEDTSYYKASNLIKLDISNYAKGITSKIKINDLNLELPYSNMEIATKTDGITLYKNSDVNVGIVYNPNKTSNVVSWQEELAKQCDYTNEVKVDDTTYEQLGITIIDIEKFIKKYDNIFELTKDLYSYDIDEINKLNIFSSVEDIKSSITMLWLKEFILIESVLTSESNDVLYFEDSSGYNGFAKIYNNSAFINISKGNTFSLYITVKSQEGKNYSISQNDVNVIINSIISNNS